MHSGWMLEYLAAMQLLIPNNYNGVSVWYKEEGGCIGTQAVSFLYIRSRIDKWCSACRLMVLF